MNKYRTLFASAILTLSFTGLAMAQEGRTARRLEAITWNPGEHKLSWTVVEGKLGDANKFEAGSKRTSYTIRMDEALMSLEGEDRRFSKSEAVSVHRLMDLVAKYAAESTVWWESGEGERVQRGNKSNVDRKKEDSDAGDLDKLVPRRRTPSENRGNKVIRISVEEQAPEARSETIE